MSARAKSVNRRGESGLFFSYLALLVWIPLPLASKPSWATAFLGLVVTALSLGCVVSSWQRARSLPPALQAARWSLLAWCLYLAWLLVQMAAGWSINLWISGQQWLLTLSYLQLYVLTLLLVNTRERLQLLLLVLVASGVFQALYGGLMTLSGVEKIWWIDKVDHRGTATGTFLSRNQLSNYLVMCLACGCGLLVAGQKGSRLDSWRRILRHLANWLLSGSGWLRLLLAVIVIGIVLTHSRMGNASLFVSLTVTGFLWLLRTRSSWLRALFLIGSLLVIDTLIIGTWFGLDRVVERLENTRAHNTAEWVGDQVGVQVDALSASSGGYNDLRDDELPAIIAMAQAVAWRGIGLGNFSTAFPAHATIYTQGFINEAHIDWLQFPIEVGVPGSLLLAVIVLQGLGAGVISLFRRQSRILHGTGFAVVMASVAGFLHATVDYNWQVPATASLYVVLLALGVVAVSLPDRQRTV